MTNCSNVGDGPKGTTGLGMALLLLVASPPSFEESWWEAFSENKGLGCSRTCCNEKQLSIS